MTLYKMWADKLILKRADELINLMINNLISLITLITKNGGFFKNIKIDYWTMPDSSIWVI